MLLKLHQNKSIKAVFTLLSWKIPRVSTSIPFIPAVALGMLQLWATIM